MLLCSKVFKNVRRNGIFIDVESDSFMLVDMLRDKLNPP